MKLDTRAQAYVDAKLRAMGGNPKAKPDPARVYGILIEGYWAGVLDMNPAKQEIVLVDDPKPRVSTPATATISGAIMAAIVGGVKK
jgi:hypothetical protein